MKYAKLSAVGAFVLAIVGTGVALVSRATRDAPEVQHREARVTYNEGVAALASSNYEAAEKTLLDARSRAGNDPELRFSAAYDLGIAFAAHAEQARAGKDADLAKALELASSAKSWFSDAARLRPDDANTKANLQIIHARIQVISDELRKGEGRLEVRLDRLIGDQRDVLEQARGAWFAVKQSGGADPLAQHDALTHLADRERGIVAEAGVVGDIAADEIDSIGKKAEDKRSDEEKVRVIQLKNLDLYLMDGRTRITEARRKLQDLAAEDGVGRAEAALVSLKRAREQLLDPIAVLRQVAQDELAVLQDTAHSDTKALQLGQPAPDKPDAQDAQAALPGWLEPKVIAERQGGIRDRLDEVRARLDAAVEASNKPAAAPSAPASPAPASPAGPGTPTQLTPPTSGAPTQLTPPTSGAPTQLTPPGGGTPLAPASPHAPAAAAGPEQDPKQAKLLARVKAALPLVGDASTAMDRARQALGQAQIKQALEQETAALNALALAIEQFSDLKQTVELAYGEHQELVKLLSPEAAKQVDAATRAKRTRELLAHNLARMPRIQELIADDLAQLEQQAGQLAAKAGEPPKDPQEAEAHKAQLAQQTQQLDQQKQMMGRAEELRGDAARALGELDKALTGNKDPQPPAKRADEKLAELRKLFFDVVEHLKELIREQGDTRDRTSAADGDDEFARKPKLPGLIERQDGHGKMAKAITDALAQQADAANKQPKQPQQQGPDPKALAGAADEVRQSQTDMSDAHATLVKARDATAQTERLEPGVKSQAKALEHLENALKLLQPPPKKNQDQQQQDQQKQDQQQQDKKQQQQQQQQQGGAGQRARDEDAKRQRERREREQSSDPVEKDW